MILEYSEPPGYRQKESRPKLKIGLHQERIAIIIEEDKALRNKRHNTAKQIYKMLQEIGISGKKACHREKGRRSASMR